MLLWPLVQNASHNILSSVDDVTVSVRLRVCVYNQHAVSVATQRLVRSVRRLSEEWRSDEQEDDGAEICAEFRLCRVVSRNQLLSDENVQPNNINGRLMIPTNFLHYY